MAHALLLPIALLAAEPTPPLTLPPVPEMPVQRYVSSPEGARIGDTLRLAVFEPWLLGGVGLSRRITSPGATGFLADARLAIPLNVYGSGRTGFGFVPTGSVQTVGSFPDHGSAGVAIGLLEDRRDRVTPGSAILLMLEAAFPFRATDGASMGQKATLLFMPRGVFFSVGYAAIPTDGGTVRVVTLGLGANFLQAFQ